MLADNQNELFPLTFPVTVAGIKQQATVLEDVSDMEAYRYRVRFEDGFEDVFTLVEDSEYCVEATEPGHDHHCNALFNDLYVLTLSDPNLFLYVLPMKLGEKTVNVWMSETEPDQGEQENIDICYNRKLQFQMYFPDEAEGWCYRGSRGELTPSQQALAEELLTTLELMRHAVKF